MESSLISELLKKYHENKLAHAFLIETNDFDKCYLDVIDLIKEINCPHNFSTNCKEDCNICSLINRNSLPSLLTIDPDGQFIKKEQILEMMEKFSTKPVFTKYNIYVIRNAERFNSSSANTILKFLEEPEENIIGIFITGNKESVISTIRSRCQVYKSYYKMELNDMLDENILTDVKLYLNAIFKNNDDILYNKTHMYGYYKNRLDWEIFFNTMLYYLNDCFISDRLDKVELVKVMDPINLIKVISLVEEIIKYIKSNCNMDLVLDKFVIGMREYYE